MIFCGLEIKKGVEQGMVAKAKSNLYDSPIRRIAASDFRSLISWLYCEHGAQWKQNIFLNTLWILSGVPGYDYDCKTHGASRATQYCSSLKSPWI